MLWVVLIMCPFAILFGFLLGGYVGGIAVFALVLYPMYHILRLREKKKDAEDMDQKHFLSPTEQNDAIEYLRQCRERENQH